MSAGQTNYSRPLRVAAGSSGTDEADLKVRLENSTVLVTADPAAPMAATTLRVLVANLRRLPVQLYLDPSGGEDRLGPGLVAELERLAASIDGARQIVVSRPERVTVHVHVGTSSTSAQVCGVADGHGARLRPKGVAFPPLLQPGTGLGGILAGAMLTAEVFKLVVGVLPERRGPLVPLDFCPVTLGEPDSVSRPLPPLKDTALIGGGAIGTAIALILRELEAEGALTVVDPETYDRPNVTTYSLGDLQTAAAKTHKVHLIRDELVNVSVDPFVGTARDYIDAIDAREKTMPTTVLGAVDSIDARHEIAAIHSTHTLDGSTGGDTGTMLSLSEATWDGPCLRCYYPQRPAQGLSVIDLLAERTGLSPERLARGTDKLAAEEIAALDNLTSENRDILERQIGKEICGLGKAFGLVGGDSGFNPSAAFVAQQAAALVVGALIRRGTSIPSINVQYDALFGPHPDMTLHRNPRPSCRCQDDVSLHAEVRARRLDL
ncbi:ThiF family adenylyltransferase [Nocardioides cavernaquae]|uniref:ThiF family adenylyltransferase n=1 Tax=Nocardioides cavernaquae TaxID=2321396 RepID=UPI0016039FF9|nr:ThiF family adenylyltransferase [Nocardioides cavernaquae]